MNKNLKRRLYAIALAGVLLTTPKITAYADEVDMTPIDIDSAIYLGLFPEWFSNRVTICGNSSLKGACRILADREDIRKIDNNNIDIIQMTMLDGYQDELIKHMSFSRMEI